MRRRRRQERQSRIARRSQVERELAAVHPERETWGPDIEDWRATWADQTKERTR